MAAKKTDHETWNLSLWFASCISLYQRLLVELSRDDPQLCQITHDLYQEFVDHFGRFKVWGYQTGADKAIDERGALDFRLRNDPNLWGVVSNVLSSLNDTLERSLNISTDSLIDLDESDSDSSDSISVLSDIKHGDEGTRRLRYQYKAAGRSIKEHIRSLYNFAALLRRPKIDNKFIKSTQVVPQTIDGMIQSYDYRHILEKLLHWQSKAEVDGRGEVPVTYQMLEARSRHELEEIKLDMKLMLRLTISNTTRRDQLEYWANPQRLLRKSTTEKSITRDDLLPRDQRQSGDDSATIATKPSFSTVAASAVNDSATLPDARTVYATTVANDDSSRPVRVPDKPCRDGATQTFTCPYCFDELVHEHMEDRTRWKRHVFRDLRPYICMFVNCQTPSKLYATRSDWKYHEMQFHRLRWVCAKPCDVATDDKAQFAEHLKTSHRNDITPRQLPFYLEMCERPAEGDRLLQCPLCPEMYYLEKFYSHLATHLEEIALFVLPRSTTTEDDAQLVEQAQIIQSAGSLESHDSRQSNDAVEDIDTQHFTYEQLLEMQQHNAKVVLPTTPGTEPWVEHTAGTSQPQMEHEEHRTEATYDFEPRSIIPALVEHSQSGSSSDNDLALNPPRTVTHTPGKKKVTFAPPAASQAPSSHSSSSIRHPTDTELSRMTAFEDHARNCSACRNPYEVHRRGRRLCNRGHRLAEYLAESLYSTNDGIRVWSQTEEAHDGPGSSRVRPGPGRAEGHGEYFASSRNRAVEES